MVSRRIQDATPTQRDVSLAQPGGGSTLPIRCVLVVDPLGTRDRQPFFPTDLTLAPARTIEWFVFQD